ncbi:hypothetical protein [Streptomyces sp. NPDC006879]|uniref:hypothetical protein n=1 Tax=Streptomyces sp. NPDC006879 TaxID=3364767 RepID=UPI00369D6416
MNLRMIGIGAGVLLAVLLPFAVASAGPSAPTSSGAPGVRPAVPAALGGVAPEAPSTSVPSVPSHGLGSAASVADEPAGKRRTLLGELGLAGTGPEDGSPSVGGNPAGRTAARCGPALSSPEGVEAQTCVLVGGGETWARTYYRNATGDALRAVLTLMGPRGRTVQIHCAVAAGDEPGVCQTPHEASVGGADEYTAVAEFAVPEEESPLLLRAGSNAPTVGGS